jgi:rubrerythrin
MEPNSLYDLMIQFVEESKSLWRLEQDYAANAGDDADLKAFWEKLAADKRAHLVELKALIKARLA